MNQGLAGTEYQVKRHPLGALTGGYLPHLDGVRGISILLVVLSHIGLGHIIPGGLGVTIFFFVSGFLITSLLCEEKELSKQISLRRFYLRRIWRLYPALFVYVVISIVFCYMVEQKIRIEEPIYAIFYASNYYNIFVGYTPVFDTYSPFGIQGSLAIEEHFYLMFAPLMYFVFNKSRLIHVVVTMLIIPVILRMIIVNYSTSSEFAANYTYGSTECRLDCIAYGCLLALVNKPLFSKKIDILSGLMGVIFLLLSLIIREEYFRETIRFSLQGVGLFLFFYSVLYSKYFSKIRDILSNEILVLIGKLSYSIYLYHWLVIIGLRVYYGDSTFDPVWQVWFWSATIFFSGFSYYIIEKPFMRFRRKYGSHV